MIKQIGLRTHLRSRTEYFVSKHGRGWAGRRLYNSRAFLSRRGNAKCGVCWCWARIDVTRPSAKAKAKGPRLAEHVLARLEKYRRDYAVRHDELINLDERRPVSVKGAGKYRRWLPEALLRVCWGLRPKVPRACEIQCTPRSGSGEANSNGGDGRSVLRSGGRVDGRG